MALPHFLIAFFKQRNTLLALHHFHVAFSRNEIIYDLPVFSCHFFKQIKYRLMTLRYFHVALFQGMKCFLGFTVFSCNEIIQDLLVFPFFFFFFFFRQRNSFLRLLLLPVTYNNFMSLVLARIFCFLFSVLVRTAYFFHILSEKNCIHMLIWNYNGCTSYSMLFLFGETRVIHRFREQRLRERASPSFSFFIVKFILYTHALR